MTRAGGVVNGPGRTEDDDPRLTQFLRGVTMGALVGAAIAGSAIWRRRIARSSELAARRLGAGHDRPSLPPPGDRTGAVLATPSAPERPAPD